MDNESFHAHREGHDLSRSGKDQFKPVLSSTHRPHHQSRMPMNEVPRTNTTMNRDLVNGYANKPQRMFELSPSVASSARGPGHQEMRETRSSSGRLHTQHITSGRKSSDTFMPLPEENDFTQASKVADEDGRGHLDHRSASESRAWASIPEMNGHIPSSQEFRSNGPFDSHPDLESQQEWRDYRSLTPEQRQQQLGSLKNRLQHEQELLQHKLQEQELLLHQKQLEIQMQKWHLSTLSDHPTGRDEVFDEETEYEGVRRKYLDDPRNEIHRNGSASSGRVVTHQHQRKLTADAHRHRRNLPVDMHGRMPTDIGRGHDELPWGQHPGADRILESSTQYPPDNYEPSDERIVPQGVRNFEPYQHPQRQHYYDNVSDELFDVDDYDPEEEDDETGENDMEWYEMRGETEGADSRRNIQGYAALHPHTYLEQPGASRTTMKGLFSFC